MLISIPVLLGSCSKDRYYADEYKHILYFNKLLGTSSQEPSSYGKILDQLGVEFYAW